MKLYINPYLATAIMAGILILAFALFKGCKQNKMEVTAREKRMQQLADSAIAVIKANKLHTDSTEQDYQDTIELERGRRTLVENQKDQSEADLDKALAANKALSEKHRLADYTDTSTIIVPSEYVMDCENCFIRLDSTNKIAYKYKDDFNRLNSKWEDLNRINQNRFKQLEQEKLVFYNQVNSLSKQQKEVADKLKPHGRLYLSWMVLCGPWPKMTGGGIMYQNKYNLIYEANWLYGNQGQMIEASIKFPLSIKL